MPVPDYQSIMLPLLKLLSDKKEHRMRSIIEALANKFQLSEEDKKELLPSGAQTYLDNRAAWARTYLKKAGLLESPKRGYIKITERGLKVLEENPGEINNKYLTRFAEFVEFQKPKERNEEKSKPNATPEEILELAYGDIRKEVSQELLNQVNSCSPFFFERLVIDLLVKMGYGGSRIDAGQAMGKSGDEGIDGVIKEDRLGLDVIYVQAKKWANVVSRPEIQKFVGALSGQKARKGVFITTSSFSKGAVEYVKKIENKVVLIDGERLTNLMIDHGVGVSTSKTYEIKKVDMDFFIDE